MSYSDVLVAMQDSEAGLLLQQCQTHKKGQSHCFSGLCGHLLIVFYFFGSVVQKNLLGISCKRSCRQALMVLQLCNCY